MSRPKDSDDLAHNGHNGQSGQDVRHDQVRQDDSEAAEPAQQPVIRPFPQTPELPDFPDTQALRTAHEPSRTAKGVASSRASAEAWSVAMSFIITILLFGGAGYGADHLFGSTPAGVLIGVFVGLTGGFYKLIRDAKRLAETQSNTSRKP